MSDISIPGVKSKYDTEKLVEDLMKVERIPLTRAEEGLKALKSQKTVWQDVSVRMSRLRDASLNLYSFRNPFGDRVALSSDEGAFTATAERNTLEQVKSIEVRQVASADRFLSANLDKDYKVASGEYSFSVGEKEVSLKFSGGSLESFAEALSRKGKDVLRAQVIPVEKGSKALLIESLRTGSSSRLLFSGAASDLALSTGMMERAISSQRVLDLSAPKASSASFDASLLSSSAEGLKVAPRGQARLPLSSPAPSSGKLVLEIQARLIALPEGPEVLPPSGPAVPATGSASYGGLSITSDPSEVPLPEWAPPPEPPLVETGSVLRALLSSGAQVALPEVQEGDFQKITIPLSELGGDLSALDILNANSHRELEIRSARVYDPEESGGLRPLKPVSTASDAILRMDGIEVRRETNAVNDLIPGVTLNLHDASSRPAKLTVKPDTDSVKEALINWVGYYNQLMGQINILTKDDARVIEEIEYLTEDERKSAEEQLGLLFNDFTLSSVRSSMMRVTSSSYETSAGPALALLAQVGISTNQRSGGGYDVTKLRGYLEIDESKLDESLKNSMEAVRQLFGNDSDGDLIVDTGLAYLLDAQVKPYVETGGILAVKRSTVDGQISRQEREIATLDERLDAKEAELRRKYGMMEGSLNQMERTSSSIDSFNRRETQ